MQSKVIFTDNKDPLLVTYLRDISKYKILDSSEINELIIEAQKGNDIARNKVVNSNLRFVVTIAKQFQHRGVPLMDLIEAGNLGLIYSVDKFNVDKGFTFLSYAVWWIKQFIYKSIYWTSKVVRLPMSQQLLVNSITSTIESFIKEHHRNPSPVEISELTNIPLDQVDFLAQFSSKVVSVDDYIGGDEENNQICDIIPDNNVPLDDLLNHEYLSKELEKILGELSIREHDLLCMLFGIGMPPVNQKVIANMFGVGRERIRQMKEGALDKLRRRFSSKIQNIL
jgi:RNA polymerase primary sigma factor